MTLFPDLQPRNRPAADVDVQAGDGENGNGGEAAGGNGNGERRSQRRRRRRGQRQRRRRSQRQWRRARGRGGTARRTSTATRWSTSPSGFRKASSTFVNRITIAGNHTTHDHVIRRELQLVERGVFNTAGLKHSVRRLNQLGFFEPLDEEQAIGIEKTEGAENEVDLTIDLTETNLNQLTFGAGVSQYDGFFGTVSFQTSNFLGRGETLGVGVQSGSRVRDINRDLHRAVPVRPQHVGQHRVVLAEDRLDWGVRGGQHGRHRDHRDTAGALHPPVPQLQLRSDQRGGRQSVLHERSGLSAAQPVLHRPAAAQQRRATAPSARSRR